MLRREAGFRVDDHVRIAVKTDAAELAAVVTQYQAALERETLSVFEESGAYVMEKEVEIGDFTATLKIAK